MERTCRKCGETKQIEEFVKAKYCKGGYRNTCKKCANEYAINHNPEIRKEKLKKWRENHIEQRREYNNIWRKNNETYHKDRYQNNKEHILNLGKIYRENNKEHIQKLCKERRKNNLEYFKKREKAYREKVKYKEYKKGWSNKYGKESYNKNKEHHNIISKKWRENNREHMKEVQRKTQTYNVITLADQYIIQILFERYGISRQASRQHPELIENYRQQIKLKRLIKTKKNENTKTG